MPRSTRGAFTVIASREMISVCRFQNVAERCWSCRQLQQGSERWLGLGEAHDWVAVFNIGAYHSKTFGDHALLAALPSSRVSLDWAQSVLFPQAIAGERVVICLRAARFWGLAEGQQFEGTLYAPTVTRSGFMEKTSMRDEVIRSVRAILKSSKNPV